MFHPFDPEYLERERRLRQTFNRWAAEGRGELMEREFRPAVEEMIGRMKLDKGERILDVGCGDGWVCRLLAPLCREGAVVGVDPADGMIERARALTAEADNVLYAAGSAEEIPWAENYFTRVISVESAYCWYSPERAAAEIGRVLAPQGQVFLLTAFYEENTESHRLRELFDVSLCLKSAEEWAELFETIGFRDVETRRIRSAPSAADDSVSELYPLTPPERRPFRESGSLLVTAQKPGLPPAGPISELSEPFPSEPFPIVDG